MPRTISGLEPSRSACPEYTARRLRKCPLTLESAGSDSLQRVIASIRGQNGLRVCTCEICHRGPLHAALFGGQKIGVDVALMGPGLHRSHARDLSKLIDIASRDYEQVGIRGNQRVKVGHHTILPDEAVGPVKTGVKVVSHHLAPVVDAGGKGGKISRQNAKTCDCAVGAVQPSRGIESCAVGSADLPGDLAAVVNGVAEIGTCTSEILKHERSVVFPHYRVYRCGAASRVAYGLASIVNPECDTVWIVTHQRKSFGAASFPQRRQRNPIVGSAGWGRGVHGTVFGISDDFSAVIDGAGLPIISAERRKSAHVAESPKKRNARKVCAEAANVFAVWI